MTTKQRLALSWTTGICLVLCLFYVAMAWLWSAMAQSQAATMERGIVSALSGDLAEGNLFKLSSTISRLQRDGQLNFAEIRQFHNGGNSVIFKTSGADASTENAHARFLCGETRRIVRQSRGGVSLITTLPGSAAGVDCATLYFSADLPVELKKLKNRLLLAFGTMVATLLIFFFWITTAWFRRILDLEHANSVIQLEKESAIGRLAAQVAHDILSPLAALEAAASDVSQLPEEKRLLLSAAARRIRGIADSLLSRHRGNAPEAPAARQPLSPQLLSSLLDSIASEKRLQFQRLPRVVIEARLDDSSRDLYAVVQPVEFERLISNLVNNAVESFDDGAGTVSVGLVSRNNRALVSVRDNGKGIPDAVLAKLGRRGETHGKAGGSGLGLYHARTSAESWGGILDIDSEVGKGTTVTVSLPLASAPANAGGELFDAVLIDDDALARATWRMTAERLGKRLRAFATAAEFFQAAGAIDRQTPVYVDSDLGEGVRGEEESRRIHEMGFAKIYMATGHPPSSFSGHPHLAGVVGKEPPWD